MAHDNDFCAFTTHAIFFLKKKHPTRHNTIRIRQKHTKNHTDRLFFSFPSMVHIWNAVSLFFPDSWRELNRFPRNSSILNNPISFSFYSKQPYFIFHSILNKPYSIFINDRSPGIPFSSMTDPLATAPCTTWKFGVLIYFY